MKILITNDDGIDNDGIVRLAKAAKRFGEVWVVAPEKQMSAKSHAITLREEIDIYPHDFKIEGVHAFCCSGTPADCIRVGSLSVMPERPDVVLSGINFGYNVATDIQYSGTAGAAFEGSFQGYASIALSEETGLQHEVTDAYLDEILSELIGKNPGCMKIYNVNFPSCPLNECKGILWNTSVSHGYIYKDGYKLVEELGNGRKRYKVDGNYSPTYEEGSDLSAVYNNYVSVSIVGNVG